jgi:hypothetical protein
MHAKTFAGRRMQRSRLDDQKKHLHMARPKHKIQGSLKKMMAQMTARPKSMGNVPRSRSLTRDQNQLQRWSNAHNLECERVVSIPTHALSYRPTDTANSAHRCHSTT